MARKRPKKSESPPLVWSPTAGRGNVRKWRLHACGCARVNFPNRTNKKWLAYVELAERFADGDVTEKEFDDGRAAFHAGRRPRLAGVSGDFSLLFYAPAALWRTWQDIVIDGRHEYRPGDTDYELVLGRFRILEDLIGPDPLPAFDPAWRSDTAVPIARGMYESRDFSAMPILADALQDAGCDSDDVLNHCRDPQQLHVRGCWVVDLVLGRPQGPEPEPPMPDEPAEPAEATPTRRRRRR